MGRIMLPTSGEHLKLKRAFDMLSSAIVNTTLATAVPLDISINHLGAC